MRQNSFIDNLWKEMWEYIYIYIKLNHCSPAKNYLELTAFKGLSKLPTSRNDIIVGECGSIAGCDFEGEALAIEVGIALPILPPVSWHW